MLENVPDYVFLLSAASLAGAAVVGIFWTGDLGYMDDDFVYFVGRNADWMRVDGENIAAVTVDSIVGRFPSAGVVATYLGLQRSGVGPGWGRVPSSKLQGRSRAAGRVRWARP